MGAMTSKRKAKEIHEIRTDLQSAKVTLQKIAEHCQSQQAIKEEVENVKKNSELVQRRLVEEKQAKDRWMNFSVNLQNRHNKQTKLVQKLMKNNKRLQEELDREQNLNPLERIQLAIESDPILESEIRHILDNSPRIQKDFQKLFLVDVDDINPFESESGPSRIERGRQTVESDGRRMVESDSIVEADEVSSDHCIDAEPFDDEGYETTDEDTLIHSGVAIAYVLSKMFPTN